MTNQDLHAQYGPKLICPLPGPKAQAAVAADTRLISPSYTRSYPLVAKRAKGCRVEDVDGNEFLDFAAGIAVVSTGHCHPEVVAAIQKQAAELIHISGTDFYHVPLTDLADRLSAVAPMPARTGSSTATPAPKPLNARSSWRATTPAASRSSRSLAHSTAAPWAHSRSPAPSLSRNAASRRSFRRHPYPLSLCLSRLLRRTARGRILQPGLRAIHRREAFQDHPRA